MRFGRRWGIDGVLFAQHVVSHGVAAIFRLCLTVTYTHPTTIICCQKATDTEKPPFDGCAGYIRYLSAASNEQAIRVVPIIIVLSKTCHFGLSSL